MTTLYERRHIATVTWRDFNGAPRYLWTTDVGWDDESTGLLWDWQAYVAGDHYDNDSLLNIGVTLAQAERTLHQLGHTIGEWDN